MNKTFKIEFQGMEKPLINMDKLNSGMESLNKLLDQSGDKALGLSEDFEKAFKELSEGVQQGSKDIQALSQHVIKTAGDLQVARNKADDLQHALDKAKSSGTASASEISKISNSLMKAQGEVNKFTAEIRKSMSQIDQMSSKMNDAKNVASRIKITSPIDPSSFESLDTLLDKEVDVRDKLITLMNIGGQVAEAFGPMGTVISAGLQLAAPVVADLIKSFDKLGEAQREARKAIEGVVEETIKEYGAFTQLEKTLKNTNKSYNERTEALNEIQSKYASYIGNIKLETLSLKQQADALALIKKRMIENMIQKGIEEEQSKRLQAMLTNQIKLKQAEARLTDEINKTGQKGFDGSFTGVFSEEDAKKFASNLNIESIRQEMKMATEEIDKAKREYDILGKSIEDVTKLTKEAIGATFSWGQTAISIRASAADVVAEAFRKANIELEKRNKAEERWIAYLQKQLAILQLMSKVSQNRQQDEQDAKDRGDWDAAQKLLNTDKEAWELEKERIRSMQVANSLTLDQIKNKQEELALAKETVEFEETIIRARRAVAAEAVKQRVTADMQAGDIKTILGANLFAGIEIPKEFKSSLGPNLVTVFKDATGKRTQQQLDQVLAEAFKTADPLKYLRERGVSSVFDAIDKRNNETFKRNADNIKKQEAELKSMEAKYQKQEEMGKRDVDAEDREKQKQFAKRQKEIDKARKDFNERVQKAEEEAAKLMSGLSEKLNDPQYLEKIRAATIQANQEQLDSYRKHVETITPLLNKVKELDPLAVTTDEESRTINVTDRLNDLKKLGKITEEEFNQITSIAMAQNELISRQQRALEQELKNIKDDFVGEALEAYKRQNKQNIKDLELAMAKLAQEGEDLNRQFQPKLSELEEENMFGQALKVQKTYGQQRLALLKRQEETEKQLNVNMYQQTLLNLEAQGFDTLQLRKDFALKQAEIEGKYGDQRLAIQKEIADKEAELIRNQISKAISIVNEVTGAPMALFAEVTNFMNSMSEQTIKTLEEELKHVEDKITDASNRINDLEADLADKQSGRRDAVLAAIELERQREKAAAEEKIRLMKKIEAEERKIARRRKALAISEAIINGALGIMQIWATKSVLPSPSAEIVKGINTAALAATTALQVATISQQKFATGGYTGEGTTKDETGHKVAGVVHAGEWVAPKWMVDSPQFSKTIGMLESSRQRGYATGGLVSNDVPAGISASLNPNTSIMREMKAYTDAAIRLSDRPVIVDVKEFSNVQSSMARRVRTNSIG